jgi:hypothetical protein
VDWLRGFALMTISLLVVFFVSTGFVLNTISTGVETRGDRVTPTAQLAQRTADILAKSREDECRRRGDRCRALEAERAEGPGIWPPHAPKSASTPPPSRSATHTDSNTIRTIQAAAMIGMCLCARYLIWVSVWSSRMM